MVAFATSLLSTCGPEQLHAYVVNSRYSAAARNAWKVITDSGRPLGGSDMSRAWAKQVDRELHMYLVNSYFDRPTTEFDWREIAMDAPSPPDSRGRIKRSNPLLLAVSLDKLGFVEAIGSQLKKLVQRAATAKSGGTQSALSQHASLAQRMVRDALAMPSANKGRSALHIGSLRFGQSSAMWEALKDLEMTASGNLGYVRVLWCMPQPTSNKGQRWWHCVEINGVGCELCLVVLGADIWTLSQMRLGGCQTTTTCQLRQSHI